MKLLKPHLSYANVVATLALIVAVSGGATAIAITAAKNSVTTKSIRKGAVRAKTLGPVVVRTATGDVQAIARCGKGERVLAGGGTADISGGPALGALQKSTPAGNGWFVLAGKDGQPGALSVQAYAICLRK